MPKRKKHERLPNAFGSIRYLGKGRKNPYAVHPPCTEFNDNGYVRPKALCYVDDWYVGFAVLMSYHAGTYEVGIEEDLKRQRERSVVPDLDDFCSKILTDFQRHAHIEEEKKESGKTFSEVYEEFYEWKFGEHAAKQLSESSQYSIRAAYKHCSLLYDKNMQEITIDDLQGCVNKCKLKEGSLESIKSLFVQLFKYATPRKYCDAQIGQYVVIPSSAEKDEHGILFSDDDLKKIWKHRYDNDVAEMLTIMCYSGLRIKEYKVASVDLAQWCFIGGLKTEYGKNRVVPIHSAIQDLVKRRINRCGEILNISPQAFRTKMYKTLPEIGISVKYTPHDCRHTFSALCEKYNVSENDRKRMLGHSFCGDVTNAVYGHRTLDDLRNEIKKIPVGF